MAPSASLDDIKKAYRRLAHQYHPDKKADDPYAAAQFREIKEAYETLTNPTRKDLYLQQRWYARSMGRRTTQTVITPETILKKVLELNRYSSTLDVHRMDKEGLYHYISHLLSDDHIRTLNDFDESSVNKEIILSIINTGRLLPYNLAKGLAIRLQKINPGDENVTEKIREYIKHSRQVDYWERKKGWIILLIVVLICLGIYIVSGR